MRSFTLRELYHMAAGAWDTTARQLAFLIAANGGRPVHPDRLNPYRQKAKTREQKELEHKEARLALRTGLRAMNRGRR